MSTPSPVTDGKRVFAMTGRASLKGFDADGQELWARDLQKDYGAFGTELGLRQLAAAPRGAALRAGAPRHEDRRALVPARARRRDRQEPLPRRAADEGAHRVARRLHDPHGRAPRRQGRDRGHGRRRGDRPRPHDRARSCGARTASTRTTTRYYRIVASPVAAGDLVVAPDARQADAGAPAPSAAATSRRARSLWSFDRGPDVPDARDRRHAALRASPTRACSTAWTSRPARRTTVPSGCGWAPTAPRRCSPTASST